MRTPEQIRTMFESLPEKGIAIHGTTLARAERINKEGLFPVKIAGTGRDGKKAWYIVQPPSCNPVQEVTFRRVVSSINAALERAGNAVWDDKYALTHDERDRITAFVLFTPEKDLQDEYAQEGISFSDSTDKPIPQENMLGVIPGLKIPRNIEETEDAVRYALRRTLAFLIRNRIIDSVRPQQPQQAKA